MPFLFMHTVLRYISHGRFFRILFAVFLRIVAALCLIGALAAGAGILGAVGNMGGAVTLGGVAFFICLLFGAYMVVHTILIRATEITLLPDSDFVVLPIIGLFLRLLGEVMACAYTTLGVGGGLLFLFAGTSVPSSLRTNIPLAGSIPFVEAGGFLAGLSYCLVNMLLGFLALTIGYLLSEGLILGVDIAANLRLMRQAVTGVSAAPAAYPGAGGAYSAPQPPMGPVAQPTPPLQGA
ncbi:MAG TPA: hypothetical protein VKU00_28975, partial [Chthonomonadaceae bacterium]|nr:hypothetical protein [Chthonomonadaceae bacterium]